MDKNEVPALEGVRECSPDCFLVCQMEIRIKSKIAHDREEDEKKALLGLLFYYEREERTGSCEDKKEESKEQRAQELLSCEVFLEEG